jgi:phosphoglycerate dehydrogenase-like enzyme
MDSIRGGGGHRAVPGVVDAAELRALTTRLLILMTIGAAVFAQGATKKIVVVGLDEASTAELKKAAPPEVHLVSPPPDQFAAELGNADALISPQIRPDLLRAARHLQWLQILNSGVEDVLPMLRGSDITLTGLKAVLGPEVADHAMALLLALTRGLNLTIPARAWEAPDNVRQLTELRGRTAVIVGMGGVGAQIAMRAAAFGMPVIGVDPRNVAAPAGVRQVVKPDQLDAVLPMADVVFIAAPDTPATRGMIGMKQFDEMKRGAYFIAVSRGSVYSMDGLLKALGAKRLAGAGVDVTDPEPLPRNHPLWKFKNVVITPHIAGASDRSPARVVELLEENIRRFAAGQPLLNTVDPAH